MPKRKSRPKEPETQPTAAPQPTPPTTATIEKPTTPPTLAPVTQPAGPAGYTIKETSWEEFESFQPSQQRKEKGKSPLRQAFEMVAFHGKVVKIEGLAPAQVRAVLAAVSVWNLMEKEITGKAPVQVKYDMKAGVVYLAPAKPETEKKQ